MVQDRGRTPHARSREQGAGSRVSAGLTVGAHSPCTQKPVPLVAPWALEQTCQMSLPSSEGKFSRSLPALLIGNEGLSF